MSLRSLHDESVSDRLIRAQLARIIFLVPFLLLIAMFFRYQVLHTTEYLARLIQEGKLNPTKTVAAKVTYHDPCHLGRLGEPYIHWEGKPIPGHIRIFEPPKEFRRGTYGIYEPPRDILKSISLKNDGTG